MRVFVLANITAKGLRDRPRELEALRRTTDGCATLVLSATLEDLAAAANRAFAERPDVVALAGGDGSFMAGLTALHRAYGETPLPALALLPWGTVATVARNLGSTGNPREMLARLLTLGETLPQLSTPTLRVEQRGASGTETRLGFIFGTGLVARFFDVYAAEGSGGLGRAAWIVARVFAASFVGGAYARRVLDPLPCRIEVDGRLLEPRAWSLVCAAVVPDLGLSMRVTYRAGEDARRPHLVASALSPGRLGPRAPLVLLGRTIGGAGHFDDLVGRFEVRFEGEGPYVLDGDRFVASSLCVTAGPSVRVVRFSKGS
jgi:diacylglycerol kinase (ATP)